MQTLGGWHEQTLLQVKKLEQSDATHHLYLYIVRASAILVHNCVLLFLNYYYKWRYEMPHVFSIRSYIQAEVDC